jgi:O-antigen ligase
MQRLLRAAEVGYAIAVLFALTQGPVYRLWIESSSSLTTSPQTSMPHIHFATFVAVQLPAVMLLLQRIPTGWFRERRTQALLGLMVWLGCSVMWSTLARFSLPEYVSLILTTSVGLYLAVSFTPNVLWRIVAVAMSWGLVASLTAVVRDWELSRNFNEAYWIGIYFNRNSLAPVAAVALLAVVGVTLTNKSWKGVKGAVVITVTTALAVLAGVMLWRAESRTSPLALGVAVFALGGWMAMRYLFGQFVSTNARYSSSLSIAVVAVMTFVGLRWIGGSSTVSGETATFNSRGALWSLSWTGFLEKPIHGWGWMSAWHTPQFFKQGKWWAVFDTTWSHNGYHDLLLGGGLVAAVLFAGVVWFGMRNIGSHTSLGGGVCIDCSDTRVILHRNALSLGAADYWTLFECLSKQASSNELVKE